MSMLSPLSQGCGTWDGGFLPKNNCSETYNNLPTLDVEDPQTHRHGITVSPRIHSVRPITAYKDEKGNGEIVLPKTFTTRKGALVLFTPSGEHLALSPSQKQALNQSMLKSQDVDLSSKFGTLTRFAQSVLTFGDENLPFSDVASISDPDAKVFLKFLRGLNEDDLLAKEHDVPLRPGSSVTSYLRNLRVASSKLHSARARPKTSYTGEAKRAYPDLSRWLDPERISPDSAQLVDQATRPSSTPVKFTEERSGSAASARSYAVLSSERLTASLKSAHSYLGRSTTYPDAHTSKSLDLDGSTPYHFKVTRTPRHHHTNRVSSSKARPYSARSLKSARSTKTNGSVCTNADSGIGTHADTADSHSLLTSPRLHEKDVRDDVNCTSALKTWSWSSMLDMFDSQGEEPNPLGEGYVGLGEGLVPGYHPGYLEEDQYSPDQDELDHDQHVPDRTLLMNQKNKKGGNVNPNITHSSKGQDEKSTHERGSAKRGSNTETPRGWEMPPDAASNFNIADLRDGEGVSGRSSRNACIIEPAKAAYGESQLEDDIEADNDETGQFPTDIYDDLTEEGKHRGSPKPLVEKESGGLDSAEIKQSGDTEVLNQQTNDKDVSEETLTESKPQLEERDNLETTSVAPVPDTDEKTVANSTAISDVQSGVGSKTSIIEIDTGGPLPDDTDAVSSIITVEIQGGRQSVFSDYSHPGDSHPSFMDSTSNLSLQSSASVTLSPPPLKPFGSSLDLLAKDQKNVKQKLSEPSPKSYRDKDTPSQTKQSPTHVVSESASVPALAQPNHAQKSSSLACKARPSRSPKRPTPKPRTTSVTTDNVSRPTPVPRSRSSVSAASKKGSATSTRAITATLPTPGSGKATPAPASDTGVKSPVPNAKMTTAELMSTLGKQPPQPLPKAPKSNKAKRSAKGKRSVKKDENAEFKSGTNIGVVHQRGDSMEETAVSFNKEENELDASDEIDKLLSGNKDKKEKPTVKKGEVETSDDIDKLLSGNKDKKEKSKVKKGEGQASDEIDKLLGTNKEKKEKSKVKKEKKGKDTSADHPALEAIVKVSNEPQKKNADPSDTEGKPIRKEQQNENDPGGVPKTGRKAKKEKKEKTKKVEPTEEEKLEQKRQKEQKEVEEKQEKLRRLEEAAKLQVLIKQKDEERRETMLKIQARREALEAELEDVAREAEEARKAEEAAAVQLAQQRKAAKEEREAKRKAELERKKADIAKRREEERKAKEEARKKEREMKKMSSADVETQVREEQQKQEAEQRALQAMEEVQTVQEEQESVEIVDLELEENMDDSAAREEEMMEDIEQLAEDEAMSQLIKNRQEVEEKQRTLEDEADQLRELEQQQIITNEVQTGKDDQVREIATERPKSTEKGNTGGNQKLLDTPQISANNRANIRPAKSANLHEKDAADREGSTDSGFKKSIKTLLNNTGNSARSNEKSGRGARQKETQKKSPSVAGHDIEEQKERLEAKLKKKEEERLREEEEKRIEEERRQQEEEARQEAARQEAEHKREMLLKRREVNLERRTHLHGMRQSQNVNHAWAFSYYVMWPRESYQHMDREAKVGQQQKKKPQVKFVKKSSKT